MKDINDERWYVEEPRKRRARLRPAKQRHLQKQMAIWMTKVPHRKKVGH